MDAPEINSVWTSTEDVASLMTRIAVVTKVEKINFCTYVSFIRIRVMANGVSESVVEKFGKVSQMDFEWKLQDFLDAYAPIRLNIL